jgi:hypothetical protein
MVRSSMIDHNFFTHSVMAIDGAIEHVCSQMILRSMMRSCALECTELFFMDFVVVVYVIFSWLFCFVRLL